MTDNRFYRYGWGVLVLAGGGAYYFAKRSINADRAERAEADEKRRQTMYRLQYGVPPSGSSDAPKPITSTGSIANTTPSIGDEVIRGKFESKEPFRSTKGDRFS